MSVQHILLTPTAQANLSHIYEYLNEQRAGLGDQFLDEFIKVTDLLLVFPELFQVVRGDIRRGIIRRFQYIFTYTIQDDAIVIARIIHAKGNVEYY